MDLMHIAELLGFGLPALVGGIAVIIGARQVRYLREITHDDSAVTRVLSGDLRPHSSETKVKKAA